MESFGLLIVALGVALANLPAAMQQWRTDRAGFTKTIELLAVYLVYCLLGGGLILWLASRGHEGAESPGKALEITGVLLGWILYGALTLIRVVPRYSEPPRWLMHFGIADIVVLMLMLGSLAAFLWT